jgi:hypothetical protein
MSPERCLDADPDERQDPLEEGQTPEILGDFVTKHSTDQSGVLANS